MADSPGEAEVQIRSGRHGEADSLDHLRQEASLATVESLGYSATDIPSEAAEIAEAIADGRLVVAERNDAIVGYAMIGPVHERKAELTGLFVSVAARNDGIGGRLCSAVVEVAKERGASLISVIGQPLARSLYERAGFQVYGPIETPMGPAIELRLGSAS